VKFYIASILNNDIIKVKFYNFINFFFLQASQESDLSWQENVEFSTLSLSEFENSAPPPRNKKRQQKKVKTKD
jgi:hypothetical protein